MRPSTLRIALLALAAALAAVPAAAVQTSRPDTDVTAAVRAALAAGQAGDMRRMAEQYAPDCVFADEFAPFLWTGPGALQRYLASGARMYRETAHADDRMQIEPPAFVYTSGDKAFVVEPLGGTATVRGRPYASRGAFAFTLARIGGRWKITSQTWAKASETLDPYAPPS
jgi:ketosteroid isomerase-like protein